MQASPLPPPSTAGLNVEFVQASDVGRIRDHNEDSHGYVRPVGAVQAQSHGWLFVVADGVGGQDLGEVASRVAVDSVTGNFQKSAGGEAHSTLLRRLVQAANHDVYEAGAAAKPGGASIGTTVVACGLRYDHAVIAHVGDSRCYLVRNGEARALTRDHSVAAEQVKMGLITAREGAESVNRHLLSRSLGNSLFVKVDITDQFLLAGDVLVLCSDGLHNSVLAADLARVLGPNADLQAAARTLIGLANERDGSDNITLQVVRIRGIERVGMYRGRPYRLR